MQRTMSRPPAPDGEPSTAASSSEVTFDVTPASRPPLPQDAPRYPRANRARNGRHKLLGGHGLPQSWEALRDEDGMVYYHNTQTGATSWEPLSLMPPLRLKGHAAFV